MSDSAYNREAAERAERAARESGWLKPSTCRRPPKSWWNRLLGFLLGHKS